MFIKGFDKNLKCRNFQFEVGKEYKTGKKDLELCTDTVFHFCKSIQQVHVFYDVQSENRFCEIEVLGKMVEDDQKCGSNHIKIVREIVGDELNALTGKINGNTGIFNSGHYNSGDYNSGYYNSGDRNSGDRNSGYYNSGDYNSGDCNSGDRNSGHYNSCDFSSGVFCNKDPEVLIFNQPSGMTMREFNNSKYCHALYSETLILTEWDEKENKLITHNYKEACQTWWSKLTKANQKIIQSMPNFDKEIFFDITGIRL